MAPTLTCQATTTSAGTVPNSPARLWRKSSSTWNTLPVPNFSQTTNYYLAIWGQDADNNLVNNFKARFGLRKCRYPGLLHRRRGEALSVLTMAAPTTWKYRSMASMGEFIAYEQNQGVFQYRLPDQPGENNPGHLRYAPASSNIQCRASYNIIVLKRPKDNTLPTTPPVILITTAHLPHFQFPGTNGNADDCVLVSLGNLPSALMPPIIGAPVSCDGNGSDGEPLSFLPVEHILLTPISGIMEK